MIFPKDSYVNTNLFVLKYGYAYVEYSSDEIHKINVMCYN